MAFRPKLFESLRGYRQEEFRADVIAGLTVGIVALPLAMAFGIASGVNPSAGIYTAIVAGFLISALGGTKVCIGGPTGAFVGILYSIVAQYGVDKLVVCTLMAGVILIIMGATGMGTMIKFIPYPVTTGFTSGIAVIIFSTQIKDFFGLKVEKVPAEFVEKLRMFAEHIGALHWPTFLIAVGSLLLIRLWPAKIARRVPGSIVALVLSTTAVALFGLDKSLGLETIGTKFGGIPQSLPPFKLPQIAFGDLQDLVRPATTIALLAAIESLLCAVVADGMTEGRHDSNQELLAQGLANIGSGLLGGIPATGAIARTATNIKNGGRTPIAGLIHATTLLPLATLSAVLVMVAFNMGEWHQFRRLTKWPRSDVAVFLTTFTLTVLVDLVYAVEIGMVLAAVLFIKRISETTQITAVDHTDEDDASDTLVGKKVPEGVLVFKLAGAFLFGAADKLETSLKRVKQEPEVLILRMRSVLAMDATGLNALEDMYDKLRAGGKYLILSAPHTQPLFTMEKAGFIDRLGDDNVCADIDSALARASQLLALKRKPAR
jgi:sulfate permease, SulP family